MKNIGTVALVAAASVTTASAGVHKMKLQKMQQTATDPDAVLANLRSQSQWLGQKYFGGQGRPSSYGYPAGRKTGDFNIQSIDGSKGPHDVPLNSLSYSASCDDVHRR